MNQLVGQPIQDCPFVFAGARDRLRSATAIAIAFVLMNAQLAAAETEAADTAAEAEADRNTLDKVIVEADRDRSSVALDGTAITGSRLGIETRDLPASISVVSQEVMQVQGLRTSIEAVTRAVGMTGGISVGSIPSFATRGFTSNDVTVMRDGIRQNTGSQSARPLDSFLFDRIEVLKGPASLLYGEGAIGGAINYVSKMPSDMFAAEAYVNAGSWNSLRYGAGAQGTTGIEDVSFRIDASRNTSDGYVDRSDIEYSALAAALRWQTSSDSSLTLSTTYLKDATNSYYGTPVVYDAVYDQIGTRIVRKANTATDSLENARIVDGTQSLNYNNVDNFARAENSFTRLIWEAKLGGNLSLRNEFYVATQRFHWRNTESTVWSPVSQLIERGSFFLIYRNDEQLGNRFDLVWDGTIAGRKNKFLVGAIYDHNDQVRNSGQVYPGTPIPANVPLFHFNPGIGPDAASMPTLRIGTDTASLYVENLFEPIDALKVIAGLRFDRIDLERASYVGDPTFTTSYKPLTGRLGVVYDITPSLNVYASVSKAAQPVSQLVSLTVSQTDFSLQKGRQYEVGMKASFGSAAEATLAIFDIEKNDLLTNIDVPGIGRVPSQIGAQVSQGLEVAGAITPVTGLHIDANFAWTWKAEYEDFNENLGAGVISRNGNTPPNVPKIVAGVFVSQEIGDLELGAGIRHVGERQANNNNGIQMDAYTTVDASIGYSWDNRTMTLRGRNLTDEQYSEWANAGGLVQRLSDPLSVELELRVKF